ncbi:MAG: energy-coupling factor ABC transporter ATP-binding protein [Armatimonadota bacterium]
MTINTPLPITVANLSVRYPDGRLALDGVSFTVDPGESVAVLGANGAGKSTLMLALVGILPAQGEISFGDISLSRETLRDIRRRVQLVFQDPDDQLFMPRVRDDVAFGPINFDLAGDNTSTLVDKYLALVGLQGFGDRCPHQLSMGEKKKAAIASVLACEPQVLLLDEPSAGLDAPGRRQLIQILNSLEVTKLVATHDLEFATQLCTRALILKSGRLCAVGALKDILADDALIVQTNLR